nr:hypothetical protein [Tanacetum cinerariifolium]
MAKKDLINKSGVARSFPGSFPQRGLNGIAGVSGGRIVGVVGSGGMAGKKHGKWSCRLAGNRDEQGQFKRGGKMG